MNKVILHTDCKRGLWNNVAKAVTITDMVLDRGTQSEGEKDLSGELRVYFDIGTWDTRADGLIYTDTLFIKELREFCNAHGLPGNDICYSEQGMQGDDYVSLDAGTKFYKAWMAKFNIEFKDLVEMY